MKGKELNVEYKPKTQEEIAKKAIKNIYEEIEDRKEKVAVAETKLAEILEKDMVDITEDDGNIWSWND